MARRQGSLQASATQTQQAESRFDGAVGAHEFLTTSEAAELLRFTTTEHPIKNLHAWLVRCHVPTLRRGGTVLIRRSAILTQLEEDGRAARRRKAVRHGR